MALGMTALAFSFIYKTTLDGLVTTRYHALRAHTHTRIGGISHLYVRSGYPPAHAAFCIEGFWRTGVVLFLDKLFLALETNRRFYTILHGSGRLVAGKRMCFKSAWRL